MPAPVNLGFERAGGRAGLAESWIVVTKASTQVAGFAATDSDAAFPQVTGPTRFEVMSLNDVTVNADDTTAPDGSSNADQIVETATTAEHYVQTSDPMAVESGKTYTFGCYLKDRTRGYAGIFLTSNGGSNVVAILDLQTGLLTQLPVASGNITVADANVTIEADGWYSIEIAFTVDDTFASSVGVLLSNDGTTTNYAGNVAKAVYAWNAYQYQGTQIDFDSFDVAWANDNFVLSLDDWEDGTDTALYTTSYISPNAYENFESGWDNFPFLRNLAAAETAAYDAGTPEGFENFEEEWGSNEDYAYFLDDWGPGVDSLATEDFESGWNNDDYNEWHSDNAIHELGTMDIAQYDQGGVGEEVEDFEEVIRDHVCTLDTATDTFTSAAHGLLEDQTVLVRSTVGGRLPAGFNGTIAYFVINETTDTFQLSLTEGGAAVNATDIGEGELSVRGDPAFYWNEPDYNWTLE